MSNILNTDLTLSEEQKRINYVDFMKKDYVPDFLINDPVVRSIYEAQGLEIGEIKYYIQDLIAQCFITTATWSLPLWEEEYGLPTIETDTVEERRSRLVAKKRGAGVTNIETIKKVCKSYSNGDVEVIPHYDEYYFTIKFVSEKGVPPKIQDIYDSIEEIKPAHLDVEYEFTYAYWSDYMILNDEYTWKELLNFTWDDIMNGRVNHNRWWELYYKNDGDNTLRRFTFK